MFAAASKPRKEKNATTEAANAPTSSGWSGEGVRTRAGSPPPLPNTMAATTITSTSPLVSMIVATALAARDSRTPRRLMAVRSSRNTTVTGTTGRSTSAAR